MRTNNTGNKKVLKSFVKDLRFLYTWWAILIVITLFSNLIIALNPLIVRGIIDVAISQKDVGLLFKLIILFVIIFLVQVGTDGFQSYMQTVIGQKATARFRLKLIRKLFRLPLSFFHKNDKGDLLNRMEVDINSVDLLSSRLLLVIISQIISMLYSLIMMAYLHLPLFVYTIIIVPGIYFFQKRTGKKYKSKSMEGRENISKLFHIDNDILNGIDFIKSNGNYPRLIHWYSEALRKWYRNNISLSLINLQNTFFLGSGALIIMLLTFGLGGYYVIGGTMTVGGLVAYKTYIERMYNSMFTLSATWLQYQKSLTGMERIYWVLDQPSPVIHNPGRTKREISGNFVFENVSFHYDNGTQILNQANFEIIPYVRNVIVGANGVGKSTLFHLISRQYPVTGGQIIMDEERLEHYSDYQLRQYTGVIFQEQFFFSNTLFENFKYVKENVSEEQVWGVLDKVGMKAWASGLPQGLDSLLGTGGIQLSGGQKQKLSLARLILKKPSVLLLDEPSSSFDTSSKEMLYKCLEEEFTGCTIILISHDLESIKEDDHVIFVYDASCVEEGTHSELIRNSFNYRKLWSIEIQGTV
ncbi:ABC transporter ATP-binding protein [Paenibacillus sp. FSL H7-0350]|uniref:ABC transporter ATP-binding protein n=1 Tax=Paenibacillus sp. FSL H7-0350 TaxID=2975345 RepID=UPI00315942A2